MSQGPCRQGREELWGHSLQSAAGLVVLGYFSGVLKFYCKFLIHLKSGVLVLKVLHLLDNSKSTLLVTPILQVKIIFCKLAVAQWKGMGLGLGVR